MKALLLLGLVASAGASAQQVTDTDSAFPLCPDEEQRCFASHWSLSAGLGLADSDYAASDVELAAAEAGYTVYDIDVDTRRLGYRLALATPLSERWQLELGYTDLGEVSTAFSTDTTTPADFFAQTNAIHPASVNGAHLSAAYRVWQHDSGEIQLHGGLFAWQAEYASRDVFENSAVDASQDEDGLDGTFGARYVYHFSPRWQMGIDVERYYFADGHGDLFSLNIRYVMGREEHAQKLN